VIMKRILLICVLLGLIFTPANAGNVVTMFKASEAPAGDCDVEYLSYLPTNAATLDIRDDATRLMIGNIINQDGKIRCVTLYPYAKDGATVVANDYHVEVWSINANGVGGCANSDGCLNTQLGGGDSDAFTGSAAWDGSTAVVFTLPEEITITSGTPVFVGATHNNAASTTTEVSLYYENSGTIARAQINGDTTGSAITDTTGGFDMILKGS
jgi:hypothetical protein